MTSKTRAIKSIFGFSIPTWINAAVGILAVPLVTRLFEPEVLGKFNLFCMYSTILYCIALAGLNQGLLRFYHEPPGRNTSGGLFRMSLTLVMVFSLIIAVIVFVFGKSFSEAIVGEDNPYIIICLVVSVLAAAILNLVNSAYRMQNKLLAYGILTISMHLCAKITFAGAALFEDKIDAAISLFTLSYVIVAIIYIVCILRSFSGQKSVWGKTETLTLLKYSLPLMPVLFIAQINTALPKIAISEYLDYAQVGIYASAFSVVSIISIVQSGINTFWAPFVFENYSKHPQYLSSGHLIITFIMTVFGLTVVLFQDVIYLIIGPNYRSSQMFFALLLSTPIFYTLAETTGIGINISKKTYFNAIVYAASLGVTLIACFLLIPKLGLLGAAIAVAAAAFGMLIVKTIIGEKYYKIVTNPVKSFFAPTFFLIVVILNTMLFEMFWIRTAITAVAIITTCYIYKKEMISLIGMARGLLNKENKQQI